LDRITDTKNEITNLSTARRTFDVNEPRSGQKVALSSRRELYSHRKNDIRNPDGTFNLDQHILNITSTNVKQSHRNTKSGEYTNLPHFASVLSEIPVSKPQEDETHRITTNTLNQSTKKLHSIHFNVVQDVSDILDNTQSELSQIFDLKINANENESKKFTDVLKPQPRPQSADRSRNRMSVSKQNMILLNNLKLGQFRSPAANDSHKKGSTIGHELESYRSELKKDMKVTEGEMIQDPMRAGRGFKGLKEILNSNEPDAQYETQGEGIGCCKRTFQKKFFCV